MENKNYKEMYFKLFSKVTDVIEELEKIQQECEKIYIENENNEE